MVSVAKIRLDPRKSVRLFKGIICDDISEFESHMPSQPVRLCGASAKRSSCLTFREEPLARRRVCQVEPFPQLALSRCKVMADEVIE